VTPVCLDDFETLARECISPMAWEYISSGAGDEQTLKWNREAFHRIRLNPRVLTDVSRLDTRIILFGEEHAYPILLAPTAYQKLIHPEGELATARAAASGSTTMVVSSFATTSIEDIASCSDARLWFQLYMQRDRAFTRDLVQRAESVGCRALVLTVDTPIAGLRNREQRAQFALPEGLSRPNLNGLLLEEVTLALDGPNHLPSEGRIYSLVFDPSMTWKDVEWLRSFTRLPLLLKGVLNPEDAHCAAQSGVAGIIVSNHGARNMDTLPATIDALPRIVERIGDALPLLLDGGIRRGTDVLKALAVGASAVLIGRPYLYGLAAAGESGVISVLNLLQREFEMAMALTGVTHIGDIGPSVIW
jgi:4-hydroxymandelate oxidase